MILPPPLFLFGVRLGADTRSLSSLRSVCRMTRSEEETSTSQVGRRRGPVRGAHSASHIISSLTMEESRIYCEIPDNIDLKLMDNPDESTLGGEHNAVFFTREQLAVRLLFLVPALVKQFFHFTRALSALIHPNIIRILTECSVMNFLYQLNLSLVEICFAYSLIVRRRGRMSMSILDSRLQFVNGLPDSPKTPGSPGLSFDINRSQSFPGVWTREWAEFRYVDIHICLYVRLIVDYWCREKLERQAGTVGRESKPREDS